jgi:hypothetical protein
MSDLTMLPDENLNEYDERLKALFEAGKITAEQFSSGCAEASGRVYISRDNPRAQSGHGSDVFRWRNVRWLILEAICGDGTFIDVGCANGHLIESLDNWMNDTGVAVEFHGLEISDELYRFACDRLPSYRPRLYHGNALYWKPAVQFDYVYTMILPDFPLSMRKSFLDNMWDNYVKPEGRLILGPWNNPEIEDELARNGYPVTGYCEKYGTDRPGELRRVVWIDKTI